MCRKIRMIITDAPHLCMACTSWPRNTLSLMLRIDSYAPPEASRAVVHREEDARDGLVQEREQRRRPERVGPVDPARNLAPQQPAEPPRHRGPLVQPVDDRDPGIDRRRVGVDLAVGFGRLLRFGLERLRERRRGDAAACRLLRRRRRCRTGPDTGYWPMPLIGSPGKRGENRWSSSLTEYRGPISTRPVVLFTRCRSGPAAGPEDRRRPCRGSRTRRRGTGR